MVKKMKRYLYIDTKYSMVRKKGAKNEI